MTVESKELHMLDELVEPINRLVHIPLAARIVRLLRPTAITPNQVTGVSVLFGFAAAWAFSRGHLAGMVTGGLLLEISLILDCVDGQLARAKKMDSDLGRLVDGVGGYLANLAVVAGIAWGFPQTRWTLAALTILTILRAIAYDYCKQAMTTLVQEGYDWAQAELEKVQRRLQDRPSLLMKTYRTYLQLQRTLFHGNRDGETPTSTRFRWDAPQRLRFYETNRPVLGLWKWNGPDLVFFLITLSALLGQLETLLLPITCLVALQLALTLWWHHSRIRYETSS